MDRKKITSRSMSASGRGAALVIFWLVAVLCCRTLAAQEASTTAVESPEFIVLKMQSLLAADIGIADASARRTEHVARLREAPGLAARFWELWPDHRYGPLAMSILIDAISLLHEYGDPAGDDRVLQAAAQRLLALEPAEASQAKAQFVILGLRLKSVMARTDSQPASMPATASAPAICRRQQLSELAGQYLKLREDFPKTPYAPAAMLTAAKISLELRQEERAADLIDKLATAYPADPLSLEGLLIVIRLHTNAGSEQAALAAKRKVVTLFSGTEAAKKYQADIARAECIGREFVLRFSALDGRRFDIHELRGQTRWVYFFGSAITQEETDAVVNDVMELTRLLGKGALVAAIGSDRPEYAAEVKDALAGRKVDLPVLLDPKKQVAQHYGVLLMPAVVKVGADGKLADIIFGANLTAEVAERLKK